MAEKTKKEQDNTQENDFIVTLSKPYIFEEKEITKINLAAMEEFGGQDLAELRKVHRSRDMEEANMPILNNLSTGFAVCIAQRASGLPFEFFDMLTMKDLIQIEMMTSSFLCG